MMNPLIVDDVHVTLFLLFALVSYARCSVRGWSNAPVPFSLQGRKMKKVYLINMNPVAWARASINTKGNKPRFYDKQSHEKLAYGIYLKQQHENIPLFQGPIIVDIIFFMKKPLRLKSNFYHSKKPDIDNLCKFLFDACSNILFTDDSLICKLSVEKVYDTNPRTQLTIKDLE